MDIKSERRFEDHLHREVVLNMSEVETLGLSLLVCSRSDEVGEFELLPFCGGEVESSYFIESAYRCMISLVKN